MGSLRLSFIARRDLGGSGGGGGGERALWHMPQVGGIEGLGSPEEALPALLWALGAAAAPLEQGELLEAAPRNANPSSP